MSLPTDLEEGPTQAAPDALELQGVDPSLSPEDGATPEDTPALSPDDDVRAQGAGEPPEVDDEERLEPKTQHVERVIVDMIDPAKRGIYVQKPLSYFNKLALYGLLGRAVKIAMSGEDGLDFDDVMNIGSPKETINKFLLSMAPPGADTAPDAEETSEGGDMDEVAKMMSAFAKVVSVAPDLLLEAYAIVLQAPKGHYKWLIERGLPTIDDEMGKDILHTFIDQNWGVMEDFFTHELQLIFKRAVQARNRHRSAGAR
jgi:hypothetical protein